MKKILFVIYIVLQFNHQLFAQLSIGPQIGVGLSSFRSVKSLDPIVYNTIVTPQVGVVLNIDFWKVLAFRPELLYYQRGFISSTDIYGIDYKRVCRLSYLELPINLVLHTPLGPGRLEVFGGVAFGYGLGGRYKTEDGNYKQSHTVKFGKVPDGYSGSSVYFNPFNASMNVGFGYKIKSLVIQLACNWGLSSIEPHSKNTDQEGLRNFYWEKKTKSVSVSFIYLFNIHRK
jgi:hypothetical protein